MTSVLSTAYAGSFAAGNPCPATGSADPAAAWSYAPARDGERLAVEHFIRERFARAYGAHVTKFMPTLMALRHSGVLLAACGLRPAEREALFLETYLDAPIEAVLAAAVGEPVARTDVVEVGNLAIARAGAARELIVRLTRCLRQAGRAWTVFTAVPALRNSFARLGIPLVALGPADAGRLAPADLAAWGTYYDAMPQVAAVSVAQAHAALAAIA